jgi:hypothetical protein
MIIGRGNQCARRNPTPLPFRPLQIAHDVTCNPTRGHSGGKPATNHMSCGKEQLYVLRTKRTSQNDSVQEMLRYLTFKQSVYSHPSRSETFIKKRFGNGTCSLLSQYDVRFLCVGMTEYATWKPLPPLHACTQCQDTCIVEILEVRRQPLLRSGEVWDLETCLGGGVARFMQRRKSLASYEIKQTNKQTSRLFTELHINIV